MQQKCRLAAEISRDTAYGAARRHTIGRHAVPPDILWRGRCLLRAAAPGFRAKIAGITKLLILLRMP